MQYRTIQNATFLLLLVGVTVAFLWIVGEFLLPVFWAVVLAILFARLQQRWLRVTRGRASLASFLNVLTVIFFALLPLAGIGYAVVDEAAGLYRRVSSGDIDLIERGRALLDGVPEIDRQLRSFGTSIDQLKTQASSIAAALGRAAGKWTFEAGQNVVAFGLHVFIMLYVLFFCFRDGRAIADELSRIVPLGDSLTRKLFARFAEVVRGTIKGTVVIGVVQGTLGGVAFAALGLEAPVLWGAVMVALSILPAIGAGLVWVPAAVALAIQGQWTAGIGLAVFGVLVIGLVDNFLRPILVGNDTKMPDYLILLSTLGGLASFGVSGFVLGPVVAALFLVIWEIFGRDFEGRTSTPALGDARYTGPGDAP